MARMPPASATCGRRSWSHVGRTVWRIRNANEKREDIMPLLANHDHQSFEVFCYSNHSKLDAVTQRVKTYADHWLDILTMTDDQVAHRIREDRIDILVDLAAHTADNRLLVFARCCDPPH